MADENEVKALADRLYDAAVSNAGSPSISVWETAQHAAREAMRWRDETRPQQPAAAVPPERDWTMIQSGDASIPAWVVHCANAIGAYMKGQNVQHWAVGPVQSRNEAKQPAAQAVPADVARHAAAAVSYLDHAGGMPAGLSLALQRLRDVLAQQPAAAVPADIERAADSIAARARAIGGLLLHDKRPSKYMNLASEVAIGEIEPLARHIAKLAAMLAAAERKGVES